MDKTLYSYSPIVSRIPPDRRVYAPATTENTASFWPLGIERSEVPLEM